MLDTQEERTEGMKRQAQELIDQAYNRGFKAGYEKAKENIKSDTESRVAELMVVGRNEAWEAARKFYQYDPVDNSQLCQKIFDYNFNEMIRTISASEAIEKIRVYESKKQEDDEIHVGDEVLCNPPFNEKCVVTEIYPNTELDIVVMRKDGHCIGLSSSAIKKTGRSFPEIAQVLEKLKEDEHDHKF